LLFRFLFSPIRFSSFPVTLILLQASCQLRFSSIFADSVIIGVRNPDDEEQNGSVCERLYSNSLFGIKAKTSLGSELIQRPVNQKETALFPVRSHWGDYERLSARLSS
jgi:hypothetical protein